MSFIQDTKNTRYYINNKSGQPGGFLEDADIGYDELSYLYLYTTNNNLSTRYNYQMSDTEKALWNVMPISTESNIIPYWKFILTSFNEVHQEAATIERFLSDSFAVYCTGATIVKVSLSGSLANQANVNHLIDFINLYNSFFRGYSQCKFNFDLCVYTEGTFFIFKPNLFSIATSTKSPTDFIPFQLAGYAFRYYIYSDKIINSR